MPTFEAELLPVLEKQLQNYMDDTGPAPDQAALKAFQKVMRRMTQQEQAKEPQERTNMLPYQTLLDNVIGKMNA